jgi:ABC-2 type transport system permease protein
MNRIFQVLKLDYFTVKSSLPRIIMIYIISILLGMSTQPVLPVILIMFFCVSFSGLSFSLIEKNKCEKLFGILPVRRIEIVIGRYLYGFLTGIVNLLISIIFAYLIAAFTNQQIDILLLSFSITIAFCYFSFSVSISYPVYYKFGFSKSFIFISLPLYLIILVVTLLAEKTNILDNVNLNLMYFVEHYFLFLLFGFILSVIMLIVSAGVSYVIFRKSEL